MNRIYKKNTRLLAVVSALILISSYGLSSLKKAKSYLKKGEFDKSSVYFYKIIEESDVEKEKKLAEYGLGKSLLSLDLNLSSALFFGETLKRGSENNPYFLKSFKSFYSINKIIGFSEKFVDSVFSSSLIQANILDEKEKNFYLFHKGLSLFEKKQFKKSYKYFAKISEKDKSIAKSFFYRGIIEAVFDKNKSAVRTFKKAIKKGRNLLNSKSFIEQANLNIARIYYAEKRYSKAIKYYSKVSRDSINWLEALFEAAWAFALMEKPNNSLGNLHTILSPFYTNRFYPEANILKAINLFQLCYYKGVDDLLLEFEEKYKPLSKRLNSLLKKSKSKKGYLVRFLKKNKSKVNDPLNQVLADLSNLESFKTMNLSLKNISREIEEIEGIFTGKKHRPLRIKLMTYLKDLEKDLTDISEEELIALLTKKKEYLDNMFEQSILITAETLLKNIAKIKRKLDIKVDVDEQNFIGGMQELVLGQSLEYWPFEGEYWEDELGGYVYNIPNICQK